QAVEKQQDLIAFHELARLLHRLGRAVAVVVGDEPDLSAVDTALGIDLGEIGRFRLAGDAPGRGRPAIWHDIADLDFAVARARIVFLLRAGRLCCQSAYPEERRRQQGPAIDAHCVLPADRRRMLSSQSGRKAFTLPTAPSPLRL